MSTDRANKKPKGGRPPGAQPEGHLPEGDLTVISAGAGSGKTWQVCREVADRVVAGLDPASVLATTFTRKAAAELEGRIQQRILSEEKLSPQDRVERAGRLELALIGTVHSVGHHLLRRYALPLGLSPELEVLEEGSTTRHLDRLLAETDPAKWEELLEVADRLSHDNPYDTALELLSAKRTNAIPADAFRRQMRAGADRLCELLEPDSDQVTAISMKDLFQEAKRTLKSIEAINDDETKATKGAIAQVRGLSRRKTGRWNEFLRAAKMGAGKRSGADETLESLREMGRSVRRASGLHDDIRRFNHLLAERTIELEEAYGRYKSERALLDFTDLEVHLLELLERPDLEESLRAELKFVVVDEFQDTNPIQLAIFLALRRLAGESVWVGDSKQAIYGFRGTDAELMADAWGSVPEESRRTLPNNYRSQAGLVRVANEIFAPVFGEEARLEPVRDAKPAGIERWTLHSKNNANDAKTLAMGIEELQSEGIALREIAVLARTHSVAADTAEALSDLGIPAMLGRPGLLYTRECALVLAGLRLVADRRDSLAAATVHHILGDPGAETPGWLEERLREIQTSPSSPPAMPWPDDPLFAALDAIEQDAVEPLAVTAMVIDALGVTGKLPRWGEAAKRSRHLDALLDMVADYQAGEQQSGGAATLTGLIAWLEEAASDESDERPAAPGVNAVTISTYHGAKGLEWPVVVLTSLDKQRPPDMWRPTVSGGNAGEGRPLEGRVLRYWPWPFGRTMFGGIITGSDLEKEVFQSPEGESAARLDIDETKRLLYVGITRAKEKVVLAHRPGKHKWLDKLESVDDVLGEEDSDGGAAEVELENCGTTLRLRGFEAPEEDVARETEAREEWMKGVDGGGADGEAGATATEFVARWHSPSAAEPVMDAEEAARNMTVERLPGENPFPDRIGTDRPNMLGNAVHAYLGALPSMRGLERAAKEAVARRCLDGFGMGEVIAAEGLVIAGDRLEEWVEQKYPGAVWHVEVPVAGPREAGGNWGGFLDLLLELHDGEMVVVDHKTTQVTGDNFADVTADYSGQLNAYQMVLKAQGKRRLIPLLNLPLSHQAIGVHD